MPAGGGVKRRFQYSTDDTGTIISELFKVSQDAILFIPGESIHSGRFLQVHLSRWMCDQFTFHHQVRIHTVRTNLSNRQTVFYLLVDSVDKAQGS